jgi:hypothetical protein
LKVTCLKNPDYGVYKSQHPMLVKYDPEMFIVSSYAKDYIQEFQAIFQKRVKLTLDKKMKLIEKDLNEFVKKFREQGKLYFRDEVDLTPIGDFPKKLVNDQIAILPAMVKLKPTEIFFEHSEKEEKKKIKVKRGCKNC